MLMNFLLIMLAIVDLVMVLEAFSVWSEAVLKSDNEGTRRGFVLGFLFFFNLLVVLGSAGIGIRVAW